ncbi:uncharacterized protein LOC134795703 [Cydia splendana]|uniref:uncharacterized protein LOC134795703 n=1 Tax=Cydia splendana TaxID=1100963 RepID=UPI0028F4ADEE
MMFAAALALLFTFAATLKPNATEDQQVEEWDPANLRKAIYEKLSKVLIEKESKPGEPLQAVNWPLAHFIDRYLDEAEAHAPSTTPDTWTINDHTEHYDLIENFLKDETIEKNSTKLEDFMFKDFIKKYEPAVVWEETEKALGRNYTNNLKFLKGLDSTDELLNLSISGSGRRYWNNQWPMGTPTQKPPFYQNENMKKGDGEAATYIMRQFIYHARNRMSLMQQLRDKYRATALYKMGYLFAKTDYACKIFGSLAFKAFSDCSMTRYKIFGKHRVYKSYMDVAYSIERLISRWFDIDILKDLLVSNDRIARNVLLKDKNLTTPKMVVEAFNEMFID